MAGLLTFTKEKPINRVVEVDISELLYDDYSVDFADDFDYEYVV